MKQVKELLPLQLLLKNCCGFDDCPSDKTEQANNHDSGDDDGCGNCSPFFSCGGCLFVTVKAESISFSTFNLLQSKSYTDFIQPYFPRVDYDFWQPPKLI